jgi:acyl-CoA synthetase (AMP-forming)/AMP-acid ligase II
MTTPPLSPYGTVIEALLAVKGCTDKGARFIPLSGEPVFHPYREVLERAKAAAGVLQARGLMPGDRVAVILPTCIGFLAAFLGVQLAGGIPAALYPPFRLGRLEEYYARTRGMLTKIGARFLVTDGRVGKLLGQVARDVESLDEVLDVKALEGPALWRPVAVDPRSPAFLQFSSGTTREPRAVIMTHQNLLANLEMMNAVFRTFPAQYPREAVCWLPLYHDMGLVGCMFNGLYHPATIDYIAPEAFIARPALWLQTLSRFRGTVSPPPQFAYSLCVDRVRDDELAGVDLSGWIIALNGAEPIDPEATRRFIARFSRWGFKASAMTPVYGLAEAGLAVTFSDLRKPPLIREFDRAGLAEDGEARPGTGREIPSVGRPFAGLELRICDEEDRPLPEGQVGKILIRGASITAGYFGDPEATAGAIRAGWLDTGDLGFVSEGELYIAGRVKDLIILRGRNIAPQEVEELLYDLDGIRPGCVVALGAVLDGQGEQLIVLAEGDPRRPRPEEELVAAVRERILAGMALNPWHVQLLDPGTLPRTSSGKMRRQEALRLFLAGELVPPEKMGVLQVLREVVKSQVAWGRFRLRRRHSA